jgi:hypothetical protein
MAISTSNFRIAYTVPNPEMPFFPSYSWELTEADYGVYLDLGMTNWVQAFWNSTSLTGVLPTLVFSTGNRVAGSTTLIASQVCFPFSGALMPFKGQILLESGVDVRGNTVTGTPINPASPTDSLSKVVVYGGNYS